MTIEKIIIYLGVISLILALSTSIGIIIEQENTIHSLQQKCR